MIYHISLAVIEASELWYLLLDVLREIGTIITMSYLWISVVLDHPVAYEFPVWAIV